MASKLSAARLRAIRSRERIMEGVLFLCAASSVLMTLAIVGVLLYESVAFLQYVSLVTFLTDTVWTPLFANPRYGILPLLDGILLSTLVAISAWRGRWAWRPLGISANSRRHAYGRW